jgi:hypothetical protein
VSARIAKKSFCRYFTLIASTEANHVNGSVFLDWLIEYQIFKKDFAHWYQSKRNGPALNNFLSHSNVIFLFYIKMNTGEENVF